MKKLPVLSINQFEQQESGTSFYSNNLSTHLKQNAKIVHKTHSHDFYLCVFFMAGDGIHEIDFNSYTITKGSVFFLRPGQMHRWHFSRPAKGYIFFHTASFFHFQFTNINLNQFPFYFSLENPPVLQLNDIQLNSIVSYFKNINTEYLGKQAFKKEKITSLINLTYIELSRYYTANVSKKDVVSSSYLSILNALEREIELHYKTEKTVQFYANALNITAKHLNRVTKATINKTTSTFILDRVILEAKRLIVHSNNSLSLTADSLGYFDYAHFSKLFKSKVGMTPLAFKKKHAY